MTKFGTRLLGEMVEYGFSVKANTAIAPGQVIGWLEGFKAISDMVCPAHGNFAGPNPLLEKEITLLNQDPYGAGWLYEFEGNSGGECISARAYAAFLDRTIDELRHEPDSK